MVFNHYIYTLNHYWWRGDLDDFLDGVFIGGWGGVDWIDGEGIYMIFLDGVFIGMVFNIFNLGGISFEFQPSRSLVRGWLLYKHFCDFYVIFNVRSDENGDTYDNCLDLIVSNQIYR